MASKINSDTTNGVVITSDTSGDIDFQSNGVTKMSVTASGITGITVGTTEIADAAVTDAKIDTMSSSKLTGALPAIDGSALTGLSGGGSLKSQVYTASGTWTNPGSVTSVKVTVVGGGGGGACTGGPANSGPGASGPGGGGIAMVTIPTSPVSITIGEGGLGGAVPAPNPGKAGGTSSFGTFASATGGTGQTGGSNLTAGGSAGSFTTTGIRIISGPSQLVAAGNVDTVENPGNGGPQTASVYSTTQPITSIGGGSFWNPQAVSAGSQGGKSIYAVNLNRGRGGMNGIVIVEWVE